MAKRKTRTVYRKAKRVYRRASGGGFKPVIDGAIAGAAGNVASKFLGSYGMPAAAIGIGIWRKNSTLKTIGGLELGAMLSQNIPFLGNGGGNTGGYE